MVQKTNNSISSVNVACKISKSKGSQTNATHTKAAEIQVTHNTGSAAAPLLDCCGNSSEPTAALNCHSISTTSGQVICGPIFKTS